MLLKVSEEEYVMLFVDMQKQVITIWKVEIKTKNCQIFNIEM